MLRSGSYYSGLSGSQLQEDLSSDTATWIMITLKMIMENPYVGIDGEDGRADSALPYVYTWRKEESH